MLQHSSWNPKCFSVRASVGRIHLECFPSLSCVSRVKPVAVACSRSEGVKSGFSSPPVRHCSSKQSRHIMNYMPVCVYFTFPSVTLQHWLHCTHNKLFVSAFQNVNTLLTPYVKVWLSLGNKGKKDHGHGLKRICGDIITRERERESLFATAYRKNRSLNKQPHFRFSKCNLDFIMFEIQTTGS